MMHYKGKEKNTFSLMLINILLLVNSETFLVREKFTLSTPSRTYIYKIKQQVINKACQINKLYFAAKPQISRYLQDVAVFAVFLIAMLFGKN